MPPACSTSRKRQNFATGPTAERSVLCIDPKGENARVTYTARCRLGPVHVLDPFGVSGRPASAYNPLDRLDPHSPDLAEDAATIADALVHDRPAKPARRIGTKRPRLSSPRRAIRTAST